MKRDRAGAIIRYIFTLAVFVILSLAIGDWRLWGVTTLILLIPPISLCINLYVRKNIRCRIVISTTATKNSPCTGSILLENKALFPASKLYCRLGVINDLTREENTLECIVATLAPKKSRKQDFLLESTHCGRVYIYLQSVRILDYFGLFALKVPIEVGARMTILPELFFCDVMVSPTYAFSEDDAISLKGDDRSEVFQLREYQSGDDIRQIHWKLSSKLDTLILKDPGQSISRSILVFWDKRDACPPKDMDAMAEVTASVCHGLCDAGAVFDLCWTEKDELELWRVGNLDALLHLIPALATQAGSSDCPDPDISKYGQVIHITSQIPDNGLEDKRIYLICTDKEYEDGQNIVFSSKDYKEKLEKLEI